VHDEAQRNDRDAAAGLARDLGLHPFAPAEQTKGYRALFASLEAMLGEITALPAVSLQPNAGSQGEYSGLLVIRAYHESRGEPHRNVCLIRARPTGRTRRAP